MRALLRRGHASQDRIRLETVDCETDAVAVVKRLRQILDEARRRPEWSRLGQPGSGVIDSRRETVKERLATILGEALAHTNGP